MLQMPYFLSCGGTSEPLILYDLSSYGINIVKDTYRMLFNGREAHKYRRLCCRLETCLINISCGKLKEVTLVFGLTIGPNLGAFTYKRLFLMILIESVQQLLNENGWNTDGLN